MNHPQQTNELAYYLSQAARMQSFQAVFNQSAIQNQLPQVNAQRQLFNNQFKSNDLDCAYSVQPQHQSSLAQNQFLFNHMKTANELLDDSVLAKQEVLSLLNKTLTRCVPKVQLETLGLQMRKRLLELEIPEKKMAYLEHKIQIPTMESIIVDLSHKNQKSDASTCGTKSQEEHTFDSASGEIPQEDVDLLTSPDFEDGFSVSVLKKRRKLLDVLKAKINNEVVITPHKKAFKGGNVNNFRGSKFRGISKNGNSWQILLMVNRKKKYLGTLPNEELAAKFYDKVAIQYQGHKAKTNFSYTKQQIIQVLKMRPLLEEF